MIVKEILHEEVFDYVLSSPVLTHKQSKCNIEHLASISLVSRENGLDWIGLDWIGLCHDKIACL